ncbi:restriction endonuclease subunit S [Pasteurella sp. PK-2025]|uniref:restriction endonuclease subunit S n=1 Tax=Pasteurella sp. PK-2025 TaxID=3413133 RepID=UPI003C70ECD2
MFKQYQEYKNSGVEWLGDVPKHWNVSSFAHLFTRKEISNFPNENLLSVYLDRGVIPYSEGGGLVHKPSENLEKYQLVEPNDFVMNNQQAWRGSVGISKYRGIVSPAYLIFTPDEKKLHPNYLNYLLRDKYIVGEFMNCSLSVGTIQRQIKIHLLKKVKVPFPNLDEQTQIAHYLDGETQKIDQLIAKQEKLIALLEEQRKSIISHAVTKGLNPNAAMKDSGVEWLGEVPEHWVVGKIKNLTTKIGSGKTPLGGAAVYTDFGILFLRSQNIFNNGIDITEKTFISESIDNEMKNTRVLAKDILLNITGGSIGRCCIYPDNFPPANVNQHVCIIRCNDKILPEMMHFFWISSFGQTVIALQQTGANREGMNFYQIANTSFPIPPITEQNQIVNYLEKENQKIDKIIQKQTALIEKLKEYRASIIAHAVTGKIDVRKM